ncbi:cysteine synthase [Thraustotheca clavata]|uniref:Cysteine synthase n=1 Tax=Thraustotheca clavata TaxID=74557 RepID=A0A1W0A2V8_9STRA|nr:cysteine synthase [Thraustotheca clavata]
MGSKVIERVTAGLAVLATGGATGIWLERYKKEWIPSSTDEVVTVVGAIGNTPLLEIPSLSKLTGCRILAKAEFLNPSGSVKDRASKYLVEAAEESGKLKPGGTIVEATGGNTGLGLALVAASKGYKSVFTMPANTSPEKVEMMQVLGATTHVQPGVPLSDPKHFYNVAKRLIQSNPDTHFGPDQFENLANFQAHYEMTGPEIWRQTRGRIDGFAAASGTGGTIGGTSAFLKEKNPNLKVWVIDPQGGPTAGYINSNRSNSSIKDGWEMLPTTPVTSEPIAEGIGLTRVTPNFKKGVIDHGIVVSNAEIVRMTYHLLRHDGIFVGPSAALNVVGAVKLARELGPGHTVVTILCDGGDRYRMEPIIQFALMYPVLSPDEKTPVLGVPVAQNPVDPAPAVPVPPNPMVVPMYGGYQSHPQPYFAPPQPQRDDTNIFWYALTSPLRLLTFKLFFFHLLNVIFAILAFTIVITGASLGIGLIPLCCLGLLVLQVLLHIVHVLSECDVYMYNCIAQRDEQIMVNFQVPRSGLYHFEGYRLSPSLSRVSTESIVAVIYFAIVKLPLALMFSLTPLLFMTTAIGAITFPLYWKDEYKNQMVEYHHGHYRSVFHGKLAGVPMDEEHKYDIALVGIALLYFAILCMHGFGSILKGTTKFFTCEFFSTTGVVNQQPPAFFYAPTAPMYAPVAESYNPIPITVEAPTTRRVGTFERYLTKLGNMLMLVLLSVLSMSFSIGVFVVVIIGVSCGLGFLPLACLGLAILNCLVAFTRPLAALDEALFRQRQQLYQAIINN